MQIFFSERFTLGHTSIFGGFVNIHMMLLNLSSRKGHLARPTMKFQDIQS